MIPFICIHNDLRIESKSNELIRRVTVFLRGVAVNRNLIYTKFNIYCVKLPPRCKKHKEMAKEEYLKVHCTLTNSYNSFKSLYPGILCFYFAGDCIKN